MEITLHKVTKKVNSTRLPGSGIRLEGYMRNDDPVSVMNPVVRFDFSQYQDADKAPDYNYAYIPAFKRFYYVTDWTHLEGHWIASMQCDVMATYRNEIGGTELFLTRAYGESDPDIVDTTYPTTTTSVHNEVVLTQATITNRLSNQWTSPIWDTNIMNTGCYILGVYGSNSAVGIDYYILTHAGFSQLIQALMDFDITDSGLWQTATVEIPEAYAKAIADPLQFIVSCRWCPFSPPIQAGIVNLKLGYYQIPATILGMKLLNPYDEMLHFHSSMAIVDHPQLGRGRWLGASPYSTYHLSILPWGEYDLDGTLLNGENSLELDWDLDWISGESVLEMRTGLNHRYLGQAKTNLLVSIPLSQVTIDAEGLVRTGLSAAQAVTNVLGHVVQAALDHPMITAGAAAFGGGVLAGMISGGMDMKDMLSKGVNLVGDTVTGLASYLPSTQPHIKTNGVAGSYIAYGRPTKPTLFMDFYLISDEDQVNFGRPLCKVRRPMDLGGFMKAESPHISLWGTAAEAKQVNDFLQGGFFYE